MEHPFATFAKKNIAFFDVDTEGSLAQKLYSPYVCGATVVTYLLLVQTITWAMKDRKPFGLKGAMRVYNFAQVALCLYMCWGLWELRITNYFRLNTPRDPFTVYFIFIHYMSKWLDYFDTIFMCLRKKSNQISFLHLFHHASIPIVWSLLLNVDNAYGTTGLGAWWNSLIHVMMYSHYFVTSFGIRNPWKKWLTKAQMFQFSILILHSLICLAFETYITKPLCILQTCYQMMMLGMFLNFYNKSYKGKKGKAKPQKKQKKGD